MPHRSASSPSNRCGEPRPSGNSLRSDENVYTYIPKKLDALDKVSVLKSACQLETAYCSNCSSTGLALAPWHLNTALITIK